MLKKSFLIVLIQAIGLIVSLLSIYLVAGDMGPEVYSLIGINAVVGGIVTTFSHYGIETAMGREALYWMEKGENEKVQEYATQALLSRLMGFIALAPLVLSYLMILNFTKYDGNYTILFLLFYLGRCVSALNNCMALIIQAQGGYVFSQVVNTLNGDIMGVIGILIYIKLGITPYLIFVSLGSIPVMFVYVSYIRKNFRLKYLKLKPTIKKIKEARYLFLNSYMAYFQVEADSLIVSMLFPPVLMGNYTIYKRLEAIAKRFIEGFFDVLNQYQVKYKGNPEALKRQGRKISLVRWAAVGLFVVGGIVFTLNPNYWIELVNLAKYGNMQTIVYAAFLVSIIILASKYEGGIVAFFAPSKTIFRLGVLKFGINILSYLCLVIIPTMNGALMQRLITWSSEATISRVVFHRHHDEYYKQINH